MWAAAPSGDPTPRTLSSYGFTIGFALATVVVVNVLALMLAVGLNAKIHISTALRGGVLPPDGAFRDRADAAVVQQIFQIAFATNDDVAFPSSPMALAPTLLVYVFAQRWVTGGLTRGAIK